MGLAEALTVAQAEKAYLGILEAYPPTCECGMDEAADRWSEMHRLILEAAEAVEVAGGRVLAVRANRVFFESDEEIDGAEHLSPEDFEMSMEDTPNVNFDVGSDGSAAEGYEITPDEWAMIEALGRGEDPGMSPEDEAWLEEAGLVSGGRLTPFAEEWLASAE